jgi:hypothetical protein
MENAPPGTSTRFDQLLHWGVAAIAFYIAIITLRRGEFPFPPPIPPVRRSDFPEGFWLLIVALFGVAAWTIWLAAQ